ncbi:MAG: glycosyltransferase family 4 protein [Myxococcota bacterium]
MRIAVVSTDFVPMQGGIATWAYDVSMALSCFGHEVTVLTRVDSNPQYPFQMIKCSGRSWNRHRAKWVGLASLKILNVDAALFATWDSALWAAPILKSMGIHTLCAVHGSEITQANISENALIKVGKYIDVWVPVSQFLKKQLRRWLPDCTSTVLPYPFDAQLTPSPHTPSGPLLCAARLIDSKNIPFVIQLAHELGRQLWLCGDGPLLSKFKHSATDVHCFGHLARTDVFKKLPQVSAVLLCSKSDSSGYGAEGFGLCLLEAASYGIPTLGTANGGIPEALGKGFVIESKSPDYKAIEKYLNDPHSGQRNWEWYRQNHGRERFVLALEKLF